MRLFLSESFTVMHGLVYLTMVTVLVHMQATFRIQMTRRGDDEVLMLTMGTPLMKGYGASFRLLALLFRAIDEQVKPQSSRHPNFGYRCSETLCADPCFCC